MVLLGQEEKETDSEECGEVELGKLSGESSRDATAGPKSVNEGRPRPEYRRDRSNGTPFGGVRTS